MSLIEKFQGLKPQQKWMIVGVGIIASFFMLGLITFWIAFNAILHRVDTEQQIIQKKQLEIKAQADKIQKQMDEKVKLAKISIQQKNKIDKSNMNSSEEIDNAVLSARENEIHTENISNEEAFAKDRSYYTPKPLELDQDEQRIIREIIAAYRKKHS